MAIFVEKATGGREYKVNDLSQADLGRVEIDHDEAEMPGLMACRAEFGPFRPFKGARITCASHMTTQTAVFVETLTDLGAEVRCCSSNTSSTQDEAAAAVARDSASVFTWEGQTSEEYWWCTERALDWGPGGGPDLIVDAGGDATLLIHEGVKAEEIYAKTGQFPDPSCPDNVKLQTVHTMIRDGLKTDPMRYHKMKKRILGVSEETTTGVERLHQMQANGALLFPAINVNDSVTKSKFSNLYGCRYGVLDGIKRATNMTLPGKMAVVCGYDGASQGCALALRQAGAVVSVFEQDPNDALQAVLRGFPVIETLDDVVSEADIFVTSINKGNKELLNHVKKMKDNTIIYDTDPILEHHSNIYFGVLEQNSPGMKQIMVDPQTHRWVSPETKSSIIVLRNTRSPSLRLSWSATSHVVALLDLWSKRGEGKHEKKVYGLSEHLEEKVSDLHLAKLIMAASSKTTKRDTKEGEADNVFVQRKSDKKRILVMVVQACSVMGVVAVAVLKASKVVDLPFSAIWGNY